MFTSFFTKLSQRLQVFWQRFVVRPIKLAYFAAKLVAYAFIAFCVWHTVSDYYPLYEEYVVWANERILAYSFPPEVLAVASIGEVVEIRPLQKVPIPLRKPTLVSGPADPIGDLIRANP